MQVANIHSGDLEQAREIAVRAGEILNAGGLVVFPTETVYGVAASAASPQGFEALRAFKARPAEQPFTIHLPDAAAAELYVDLAQDHLKRIIRKLLPGPVTVVVDVEEDVIQEKMGKSGWPAEMRGRLYHENTVGLRCPDMTIAQHILGAIDAPIIASSANLRDQPPPLTAQDAAAGVGDVAELIIDGGPCRYAKPSTIVRIDQTQGFIKPVVVRPGVYDERFINKLTRWTVVFVCTGNTCRSPMAEGLAKSILAKDRGVGVETLESSGVSVFSAGVSAVPGFGASQEAVEVMGRIGVDLGQHRSRQLGHQMIREADVIYCMTAAHRRAVLAIDPSAEDRALLLDPNGGDIDDPIGADAKTYQRCAELIRRRVQQRLIEQEL